MKVNISRVEWRIDRAASGATAERASDRKNIILQIYGQCNNGMDLEWYREWKVEIRTRYSYRLNQSMNGKIFPASPVKKQQTRNSLPMLG
jgi:hypothetical protein